ncbi:MAG TPA: arginine--tRNA ligase [Rhodospirillaceae bacterium]|nr:arginine--tRNA ligase [Magnetovibrio sp.]HCS68537.1 arginine--tRNA ligase [Rhodospirillaceae bacterium]|tara:strand:+ start:4359 stop:6119 length:1761 start_codon:yes stop_codon:yes gene_type:complete
MNLFQHFQAEVTRQIDALIAEGALPAGLDTTRLTVEPPRDTSHGDITTNAAMVLAKPAGMKPRDIADLLAAKLDALPEVTETTVAGPGFINMRLADDFWHARLAEILTTGTAYGDSDFGKAAGKVNVEYVSANPTGPLHVAHARGAVVGDVLARLLKKAGYDVTTEYYINDAGAQVETLARSAYLRYREALGETVDEIPEGMYPGEYLIPVGQALAEADGDKWLNVDEDTWLPHVREFTVARMMTQVKEDLAALGIQQDVYTSEKELVAAGAVDAVYQTLADRGLIYTGVLEPPKGKPTPDDWEPRPQSLFRATEFGDDIDRPLKKSDGSWTYFSNDIANHLDKFKRGFTQMIDIFGADHGGYVKRMKAAVTAVSEGKAELDIKLCQMVHLMKNGEPMRMSKRAGNFVTLRDLIDEVGRDVVRFLMLTRKSDTQMEFDLAKAVEQSRDNPVFYVQYAHARCRSVLRSAPDELAGLDTSAEALAQADLSLLADPAELDLVKIMAAWPRIVEQAAEAHEPHRVAFYLNDVASAFHGLWNMGKDDTSLRFIQTDTPEISRARMALVQATATIIASGLDVLGVTPVEELR